MKRSFLLPLFAVLAGLFATSALAVDGGFLLATFKGEGSPKTEPIDFGLSRDGLHWEGLNNAEPVLVSKLGQKGVRDPFLFRHGAVLRITEKKYKRLEEAFAKPAKAE